MRGTNYANSKTGWDARKDRMSTRLCLIESASIVDANDAGDGAYDLHGEVGTPDEIGKAIAESLKTIDLFQGKSLPSRLAAGHDLFLVLRIKIAAPKAVPSGLFGITRREWYARSFARRLGLDWPKCQWSYAKRVLTVRCGEEHYDLICNSRRALRQVER